MNEDISVIVPFYNGNAFMPGLLNHLQELKEKTQANIKTIIIVNDSPWEKVRIPDQQSIDVLIVENIENMGIQASRIHGLNVCQTPLVIFLDQDDQLLINGFKQQIELINDADIVVGNGMYQYGNEYIQTYKNKKAMNYLIKKKRFIQIRNLIPSPGNCLIRKDAIAKLWKQRNLKQNGADDWYLWMLLFANNCRFSMNDQLVYQHNSTVSGNLSFDLKKMYESSLEMCHILEEENILSPKERKELKRAVTFKYLYDTKQLTRKDYFKYIKPFIDNVLYKIKLMTC